MVHRQTMFAMSIGNLVHGPCSQSGTNSIFTTPTTINTLLPFPQLLCFIFRGWIPRTGSRDSGIISFHGNAIAQSLRARWNRHHHRQLVVESTMCGRGGGTTRGRFEIQTHAHPSVWNPRDCVEKNYQPRWFVSIIRSSRRRQWPYCGRVVFGIPQSALGTTGAHFETHSTRRARLLSCGASRPWRHVATTRGIGQSHGPNGSGGESPRRVASSLYRISGQGLCAAIASGLGLLFFGAGLCKFATQQ
mmetsp:Transcript_34129/g.71012  ORF Transcript_34129/g.71012 Transcript_34129/m.71012 type:complete len:247 (+) Transcript_34129:285-1025(+)